jgi:hypothetical protein
VCTSYNVSVKRLMPLEETQLSYLISASAVRLYAIVYCMHASVISAMILHHHLSESIIKLASSQPCPQSKRKCAQKSQRNSGLPSAVLLKVCAMESVWQSSFQWRGIVLSTSTYFHSIHHYFQQG